MIDCYASRPHYLRHCQPILDALGSDAGTVYTLAGKLPRYSENPVLIAGASDLDNVGRLPVILTAHGAEQTYVGIDHRSWAGGSGREKVGLFLVPRLEVARANLERYPTARAEVVGCPALDRHYGQPRPDGPPVVAFTAHPTYPAGRTVPELTSALDHYVKDLPEIVAQLRADGVRVLGHFHPRARSVRNVWRRLGVEVESDWDAVLSRASVVVADNTSALPEAAACGLGTVWLNHPSWRRGVSHGGRFWQWPAFGTMVDGPDEVVAAVLGEIGGPRSAGAMESVYTYADGGASERAADAIRAWSTATG